MKIRAVLVRLSAGTTKKPGSLRGVVGAEASNLPTIVEGDPQLPTVRSRRAAPRGQHEEHRLQSRDRNAFGCEAGLLLERNDLLEQIDVPNGAALHLSFDGVDDHAVLAVDPRRDAAAGGHRQFESRRSEQVLRATCLWCVQRCVGQLLRRSRSRRDVPCPGARHRHVRNRTREGRCRRRERGRRCRRSVRRGRLLVGRLRIARFSVGRLGVGGLRVVGFGVGRRRRVESKGCVPALSGLRGPNVPGRVGLSRCGLLKCRGVIPVRDDRLLGPGLRLLPCGGLDRLVGVVRAPLLTRRGQLRRVEELRVARERNRLGIAPSHLDIDRVGLMTALGSELGVIPPAVSKVNSAEPYGSGAVSE